MNITSDLTDAAVLRALGSRLERQRIDANLTQAALAEQAGVAKRTLERIEAGLGCELSTLVRLLRALDLSAGFDRLIPELPPSPIAQLKLKGKQRRRVHPKAPSAATSADVPPSVPGKAWSWRE